MRENFGPLRQVMENAVQARRAGLRDLGKKTRVNRDDFTVLSPNVDPFRRDTDANHRDARWLADAMQDLGIYGKIHVRGLHYAMIGRDKPDGTSYVNTAKDWDWIQDAAKSARWLGYVPFEDIADHKNGEPLVREFSRPSPYGWVSAGTGITVYTDITPEISVEHFTGMQPYHLVMFGEKSSLEPILGRLAEQYSTDLYITGGEPSDTLLHRMATSAVKDPRPMAVLTFTDCDPAGWQMPLSIARKLQAFRVLMPDMTEFEVHRVGLLPDHVQRWSLPSTPLKEKELRQDDWRAAFGIDGTEIDAMVGLYPRELRQLAEDVLRAFTDTNLDERVRAARGEWHRQAGECLDAVVESHSEFFTEARAALDRMRDEVENMDATLREIADEVMLPDIDIPEAGPVPGNGVPLIASWWDFAEQCDRLKAEKGYGDAVLPAGEENRNPGTVLLLVITQSPRGS